ELPVPPLALPDPAWLQPARTLHASETAAPREQPGGDLDAVAALAQVPAVALFTERACAARRAFGLTVANAGTVATIFARLDGLDGRPLALELAAPRLNLLTPAELLAQLEASRLQILTHGPRDLPERQRTLRHTLAWSEQLLSEHERAVFRWLAVFVGGATV